MNREWKALLDIANKEEKTIYCEELANKRNDAMFWISTSFNWTSTPEGYDFWSYVYDRLNHISDLSKRKNGYD